MLRTRLWMGAVLVALAVGMLVLDQRFGRWHPFLLLLVMVLSLAACLEFLHLLPVTGRPRGWLCYPAVLLVLIANWVPHVCSQAKQWEPDPWHWIMGTLIAVVLSAFVVEMALFRGPGQAVTRIAQTLLLVVYLGLLPSFFVQLGWLDGASGPEDVNRRATLALALAIFVPKCCDIGAYFTGRFLGRHRATPILSPKKTWEGLAGGLATAVGTAVVIVQWGSVLPGVVTAVGFGLTVGVAGILGDLAESLIKRDCQAKDASQVVPGFGGVLDVVDSVLFAAPVAYYWLK